MGTVSERSGEKWSSLIGSFPLPQVKEQNGPTFIDEVTGRTKITKYTDAAHPAARRQDQAHF